ncbi:hypothetical protein BCR42DRAFT_426239 [Absidia repens]|uniref:Uncharacterized protein n=1 Tax=Absidia repens TaxID=90262 RepID=A0A1X2I369_9FUNG|nr:hypothetical protein BCR42DRAFT_426239 [Absidia repens]
MVIIFLWLDGQFIWLPFVIVAVAVVECCELNGILASQIKIIVIVKFIHRVIID